MEPRYIIRREKPNGTARTYGVLCVVLAGSSEKQAGSVNILEFTLVAFVRQPCLSQSHVSIGNFRFDGVRLRHLRDTNEAGS